MTTETTTEKRSSSYKLWEKRLRGDTLTRGQIRQFCNAIAAGGLGYEIGGQRTKFTPEETATLLSMFTGRLSEIEGGGYKLTAEHTEFGLAWLRDNPRLAERAGIKRETLTEILATFREFRFVWVHEARRSMGSYREATIVPVWRIFYGEEEVKTVDYWAVPWQQDAY
jgi:hypothetical protein